MKAREQARKLYTESGGKMLLKDIAAQLSISEGTLRSWKKRDNWDGDTATLQTGATQRKRRAQTNRKAAEEIEANEELSDREKDFCASFVNAPNASQAAMRTGRYDTYGSARTAAYEMMQKPAVQAEIKRLRTLKHSMILADADDVVEMHMRIAFADITSFVEFGREEVAVMGPFGPLYEGKGKDKKPITKTINTVRFKENDQVDGLVISEVKQGRDGASVKLADRQKSLDFLERYFVLNPMDKHKKAYDEKRFELEAQKQKAAAGDYGKQDDGFMDAMKAVAQEVWGEDERNSGDVPL